MHVQWVEVYFKACCIANTSPSLTWKNKVIGGNQSRVRHRLNSLCCRRVCRCVFLAQLTVYVMLKLFVCVSTLGWRIPPQRRFQRRRSASSRERWDLHVGLFQYVTLTFVTLLLRSAWRLIIIASWFLMNVVYFIDTWQDCLLFWRFPQPFSK